MMFVKRMRSAFDYAWEVMGKIPQGRGLTILPGQFMVIGSDQPLTLAELNEWLQKNTRGYSDMANAAAPRSGAQRLDELAMVNMTGITGIDAGLVTAEIFVDMLRFIHRRIKKGEYQVAIDYIDRWLNSVEIVER